MTQLPTRPKKTTATGLSKETDAFLTKLMKQQGMSHRKMQEIQQQVREQGSLPKPAPPPKKYQPVTKPRPEQKVFTMARVGQRPLVKQAETILEETNYYQPEIAPSVPLGPSADEQKKYLATQMYGIDEEAEALKRQQELEAMGPAPEFTIQDQILEEIQGRTEWLEEMHELGVHDHDGETLRQIDLRMDELKKLHKH